MNSHNQNDQRLYLGMTPQDAVDTQDSHAVVAVAAGIHCLAWEDNPAAAVVVVLGELLRVQEMLKLVVHQRYLSRGE